MKARVKETGEIVDVQECAVDMYLEELGEMSGRVFHIQELDFDNLDYPDYWTRLEHQYAGMAMQGLMSREYLDNPDSLVSHAIHYAHALVEKMKEDNMYETKRRNRKSLYLPISNHRYYWRARGIQEWICERC